MKSIFSKFEYEILIFTFLLIKMIYERPYFTFTLSMVFAVVVSVFITWGLGKLIREADEKLRRTVILFVAFLLGSSVLNSIIYIGNHIRHVLIVENFVFVFCLIVAFNSIGKTQGIWRIPALCFICCAVHPALVFIFMPAIALLILYDSYSSNHSSQNVFLGVACLIAATAALLLFGKDVSLVDDLSISNLIASNWKNIVYSLFIIFPLIIIFIVLWISTIRSSKDKPFKFIVFLIMLEPVFSAPAMAFNKFPLDVVLASTLVQFCFLFYFLHIKNVVFLSAFNRAVKLFDKSLITPSLILIYLSAYSISSSYSQIGNWLGY